MFRILKMAQEMELTQLLDEVLDAMLYLYYPFQDLKQTSRLVLNQFDCKLVQRLKKQEEMLRS